MKAKIAGIVLGALMACGCVGEAEAAYYNFSFVDSFYPQLGSLSGTFDVNNGLIVGITGSGDDVGKITGLLPPGSFPQLGSYDYSFYDKAPYLDGQGVSFATSLAGNLNLYYSSFNSLYVLTTTVSAYSAGSLTVELSTVPLPTSGPLFGAALLSLAALACGAKRRRQSKTT